MQVVSVPATFAPSFSSYSKIRFAEMITDKVTEEFTEKFGLDQSSLIGKEEDRAEDDDFEFTFVCRDSDVSQSISADEIFANGKIRPMFPIFDQNLQLGSHDNPVYNQKEHSNKQLLTKASSGRLPLSELFTEQCDLSSSTSSESDECERVRSGTYCIWTPKSVPSSPPRITCKKSYSCGSPRRFRLKDLIHRSNSDVNDSFVFFSPSSSTKRTKPKKSSDEKKVNEKSSEVLNPMAEKKSAVKAKAKISSHEHYLRNRALKEGERRRTYLPYRRDLIGFFGYLNGWSFRKLHHPFQNA